MIGALIRSSHEWFKTQWFLVICSFNFCKLPNLYFLTICLKGSQTTVLNINFWGGWIWWHMLLILETFFPNLKKVIFLYICVFVCHLCVGTLRAQKKGFRSSGAGVTGIGGMPSVGTENGPTARASAPNTTSRCSVVSPISIKIRVNCKQKKSHFHFSFKI